MDDQSQSKEQDQHNTDIGKELPGSRTVDFFLANRVEVHEERA
jgi:hypothetical protein